MTELRLHKRITYDIRANWKLIVANYNECLHCPLLHPALNKLTDYMGSHNEPAQATYIGGSMGFREGVATMSADGKQRRDYLPGLSEQDRNSVLYYVVYPNLLLSLHPDYMMTHTLWPRAVDRTEVVCEWYFHPARARETGLRRGRCNRFLGYDESAGLADRRTFAGWHSIARLYSRSLFQPRGTALRFRSDSCSTHASSGTGRNWIP